MAEDLKYTLRADANPFNSAVASAEKGAKKFQDANKVAGAQSSKALKEVEDRLVSMKKAQNTVAIAAKGIGAAFAASTAVVSVVGAQIIQTVNEMDDAGNVAQKLGLTTEALTSLRYAVSQTSSVTEGQFDTAMQRMTRRLSEAAQGTGEAQGAIKELGLNAQELNNMSPDQAFKKIADRMAEIPKQSDRVRLAFKLFDTEGVDLVNTLQNGSSEIELLQQKAIEIGVAFNDEAAVSAANFNDNLAELTATFKGLSITLINDSGVITWLSREFKELSEDIQQARKDSVAMTDPINALSAEIHTMRSRVHELQKEIDKGQNIFVGRDFIAIKKMQDEVDSLTPKIAKATAEMQKLVALRSEKKRSDQSYQEATHYFNGQKFGETDVGKKEPDKKVLQEKARLQDQINRLVMTEAEYRNVLLSKIMPENQALQKKLWLVQDNTKAEEYRSNQAWEEAESYFDQQVKAMDSSVTKKVTVESMLSVQNDGFGNISDIWEKEQEAARNQIGTLETLYSKGLDREAMFRNERLAMVQNALDQEVISTERAEQLKAKIRESFQQAKLESVSEGLGNLSVLMNTQNEKMFAVGKAAAIAQAVIDTYSGATKALAQGGIIGPFLAGTVVAAGMANIAQIRSQQFTPSAEGGFDIPAGVNPVTQLHEKEMVLPKPQADVIRSLASASNNQSSSSQQPININLPPIETMDARGVRQVIADEMDFIVNGVRRALASS